MLALSLTLLPVSIFMCCFYPRNWNYEKSINSGDEKRRLGENSSPPLGSFGRRLLFAFPARPSFSCLLTFVAGMVVMTFLWKIWNLRLKLANNTDIAPTLPPGQLFLALLWLKVGIEADSDFLLQCGVLGGWVIFFNFLKSSTKPFISDKKCCINWK